MFDPAQLALFIAAGLALNLTPGPDLLYITARSLAQGWRAGAASAFGISAGCLVHTAAAAFGVSLILRTSEMAYDVMRLAGAAYLIWMGIKTWLNASPVNAPRVAPESMQRVFWQGFVTNALNPKVALFFLAFLPQFADPARGSFALQVAILGAIFIFNGLWVCLAVAFAASRFGALVQQRPGAIVGVQRASGVMLVGLGTYVAVGPTR